MKAHLYRWFMKFAHRHHWHYAPPVYPDGDIRLWCQWCGFQQTIKRAVKYIDKEVREPAQAQGKAR